MNKVFIIPIFFLTGCYISSKQIEKKYLVYSIVNNQDDTLIYPNLVNYTTYLCEAIQIKANNDTMMITVETNAKYYGSFSDGEVHIDGYLNFSMISIPPKMKSYFFIPKCETWSYEKINSLLNQSKIVVIIMNDSIFKINASWFILPSTEIPR